MNTQVLQELITVVEAECVSTEDYISRTLRILDKNFIPLTTRDELVRYLPRRQQRLENLKAGREWLKDQMSLTKTKEAFKAHTQP